MPEEGAAKCFAYVQTYDTKPKRRLFELMKSQGLQANQQVTFLSDGADDVRELPLYLSPESEHWLDWFHVATRLRVMGQIAKGLVNEQNMTSAQEPLTEADEELHRVDIGKQFERVNWFLWHDNVAGALHTIEDIEDELDLLPKDGESRKKLLKAVREFRSYIEANQNFIPNYGDRYRHGEKISTAFAESAVNQVISKRMVSKCNGLSLARTTYCRSERRCSITNSGRPSFAGIRECKTNRSWKFRRRPHSPRFEMLSKVILDGSRRPILRANLISRTP
jgi:hypothetical protein